MTLSATHENTYLETQPIGKLMFKFAVPCVIAMLVNSLYNIVDQIFIGRGVGYLGNGATNVVFPITVVALALALLIGDGAAAYYSLKMGEKSPEKARKSIGNGLFLLAVVGVTLTVGISLFLNDILYFFGSTPLIQPYAFQYGGIIVLGLPLVLVGTGANAMIRATGNPAFAMKSMIVGAIINTILDPLLIFTFDMGVFGAAVATVLGQLATCVMPLCYLLRKQAPSSLRAFFRLDKEIIRDFLGCGVSSFVNQLAICLAIIIVNLMLVTYGAHSAYGAEIPLTAVGIVMKMNQVMVAILVGLSVGSQPIIGYNYGAGNFLRVRKTLMITQILTTCCSCVAFIVFVCFPQIVVAIFGASDPLYDEFTKKASTTFLMLCLVNGFQISSGVFFQAIGKPLKATIISLSRQVLLFIPLVMTLPKYYGVDGVLYAGPIADGLAFCIALVMIVREMAILQKPAPVTQVRAVSSLVTSESARLA